ncbi:MAG: hypothetical protein ACOVSW_06555 [Candidatus Kapaibacteriota bacterium]
MKYLVLCHILVFFVCLAGSVAQTQDSTQVPLKVSDKRLAQNTVFLELFGNSLVYSINYERTVSQNFSLRAGFSYVPMGQNSFVAFPLLVNGFLGEGAHRFEASLGTTIVLSYNALPSFTGRLGYRYQPLDGGFNFAIAYTPLFSPGFFVPLWIGISLGWGF